MRKVNVTVVFTLSVPDDVNFANLNLCIPHAAVKMFEGPTLPIQKGGVLDYETTDVELVPADEE